VGCRESAEPDVTVGPPKPDAKVNGSLPRPAPKQIDVKEAVRIAEWFVRDNGYTDFAPKELAKLQPEGIDFADREKWLASRSRTLLPKARGIKKGGPNGPKGWIVGFARVNPPGDPDKGRSVTMDEFGEHVKMQHQDYILKYLEFDPNGDIIKGDKRGHNK
jgi:hypothetical protein